MSAPVPNPKIAKSITLAADSSLSTTGLVRTKRVIDMSKLPVKIPIIVSCPGCSSPLTANLIRFGTTSLTKELSTMFDERNYCMPARETHVNAIPSRDHLVIQGNSSRYGNSVSEINVEFSNIKPLTEMETRFGFIDIASIRKSCTVCRALYDINKVQPMRFKYRPDGIHAVFECENGKHLTMTSLGPSKKFPGCMQCKTIEAVYKKYAIRIKIYNHSVYKKSTTLMRAHCLNCNVDFFMSHTEATLSSTAHGIIHLFSCKHMHKYNHSIASGPLRATLSHFEPDRFRAIDDMLKSLFEIVHDRPADDVFYQFMLEDCISVYNAELKLLVVCVFPHVTSTNEWYTMLTKIAAKNNVNIVNIPYASYDLTSLSEVYLRGLRALGEISETDQMNIQKYLSAYRAEPTRPSFKEYEKLNIDASTKNIPIDDLRSSTYEVINDTDDTDIVDTFDTEVSTAVSSTSVATNSDK